MVHSSVAEISSQEGKVKTKETFITRLSGGPERWNLGERRQWGSYYY